MITYRNPLSKAGWLISEMAHPSMESKIKEFIANSNNKLLIYAPTPESYDPWLKTGTRVKIGSIKLSKGTRDVEIELGRAAGQGGRMVGFGHSFANQKNQGKQWWRMDWHSSHGAHTNDAVVGSYHFHTLTAPK